MKKQSKELMLVAIALLALVALPLVGCKHEADSGVKAPEGFVYVKGGTVDGTVDGTGMTEGVFVGGKVTLSDFFMGKYEVTQAEYEKYCSYTGGEVKKPSEIDGDGDNYPAYYVSWYDAVVYCNKRSIAEDLTPCYKKDGETDPSKWGEVPISSAADSWKDAITCDWTANGYRLPTEAEWEYAARGGNPSTEETAPWSYTHAGGNTIDDVAWHLYNSENKTHQVGTKAENSLGIHDMTGNVEEWCWDWYESVSTGEGTNPTGPESGSSRVVRGGSWLSFPFRCKVSSRSGYNSNSRRNDLGFRVVRGL